MDARPFHGALLYVVVCTLVHKPSLQKMKKTSNPDGITGFLWLRGPDLNRRPPGYPFGPPCRFYRFRRGIKTAPKSGAAAEIAHRLHLPQAAAMGNSQRATLVGA